MADNGGTGATAERFPGLSAPGDPRSHPCWTPLARALAAAGDQWTLMIALQLAPGRMRLAQLHSCIPGVSAGVLERYLKRMVTLGLVTRTRFKEMPPRVELELTTAGEELIPIAGDLARWGMRHMWSPPKERERIDIACLLRILPVLLDERAPPLPDGSVAAVATHAGSTVRFFYRAKGGRLTLADGDGDKATACVRGSHKAWVAALGPEGDCKKLRFTGDQPLALSVFEALSTLR